MSLAHIVLMVPGAICRPLVRVMSPSPKSALVESIEVESSMYWSWNTKFSEEENTTALSDSLEMVKVKGDSVNASLRLESSLVTGVEVA